MKTKILSILLIAALKITFVAQDAANQLEDRAGRQRGQRGPGRLLDRIPDELGLDDSQRAAWDEIVTDQRAQGDAWRARMRELRRARRDGDEARAAELEAEIGSDAWDPARSLRQSLEALSPALDAEQQQRLSDLTERLQRRREAFAARGREGRLGRGPRGTQRMLERTAESLDLSDEQRTQFDQILADHQERIRAARPLSQELWQARRDGDTKRVNELQAQLKDLGAEPRQSLNQAMNEIESILEEAQAARFQEARQRMAERNQRREFLQDAQFRVPAALDLDDQQRAEYDELLRGLRQELQGQWEQVRALRRDIREAQAAGDEARVESLQAEWEMAQPDFAGSQAQWFDDISRLLREDQLPLLKQYYPSLVVVPATRPADVRDVLRAALRSGLTREQRHTWRAIMHDAMTSIHEIHGEDKEAEAQVAAETREKIEALLTDAQLERFQKELKRQQRRPHRP